MAENMKDVEINVVINGRTFNGIVQVNTETDEVSLGSLATGGERASYRGHSFTYVDNILKATALRLADCTESIQQCGTTGYWVPRDEIVYLDDGTPCCNELTVYFNSEYYYIDDCSTHNLRGSSGEINVVTAPDSYWNDLTYCTNCECYIEDNDDYWGDDTCIYCHREEEESYPHVIEDYCESHHHTPVLFGEYKDTDSFVGLGFELEVDCDYRNERHNNETADKLISVCGLSTDEMRYAYDDSLNCGFEIISQPHTVKDFWEKTPKWDKMLKYLHSEGYKSHDARTCGLHVHVSRLMFGRTKAEQDRAIAKIYTFFDDNWEDIVKVSRRRSFTYCDKNELNSEGYYTEGTLYDKWKKASKTAGGHHVALNNNNSATFEYRLGRGTLNSWSFFSWIDFVIVITNNAKRITVNKVVSNDRLSWLGGIKESTAKYMYKRGAFTKEVTALYPNITWETDLIEQN